VAGKYSIQAPLGYGGATATYRASTAQGREVAVKLFEPTLGQRAEIMSLLERTYASTNALPPDGAVPVVDAGYDQSTGAPYSATELIAAPSLARLVQSGPMPPDAVASFLRSLGRTVDLAHSMQLSHHGLAPTNVFVGPAPTFAARISDFGLENVRRAAPTPEGQARSAPWVAPEQVQGAQAGPQADVFSAGLLVFFALTGRSYWRSCQGAQPDLARWMQEIMAPRTLASARAAELGVSLNPAFDGPLARALSLDPNERYRSVGELAASLGALVSKSDTSQTAAFPSSAFLPPEAQAQPPGGWGGGAEASGSRASPRMPSRPPPVAGPPLAATQLRAPQQQSSSGKLVPVLIAAAAVLLLGGAAAAWYIVKLRRPVDSAPIAIAPVEATTTPPATEPLPSAEPTAAPTAEPVATDAEVTITCAPACDEVLVDGKAFTSGSKLTAGEHAVSVSKAGFTSQSETITVEAGKPLTREFTLAAAAAPPSTAASNPPSKPSSAGGTPAIPNSQKCGKFLKRCKD
jgi:serine/threonine protein kinase